MTEEQPKHKVDLLLTILLVLVTALMFGVIGFGYGQRVMDETKTYSKFTPDFIQIKTVAPAAGASAVVSATTSAVTSAVVSPGTSAVVSAVTSVTTSAVAQ